MSDLDSFANEAPASRAEAFQEAAARLGFSQAIIEKDFWVCWSLEKLFALPSFGDHLIFKGGTSLSKAYAAIHRFSEDVDLSLDRAQLGFVGDQDPENPDISGGRRKALLEDLQSAAETCVNGPLLSELTTMFTEHLADELQLVADPLDTQTLLFTYPSGVADGSGSNYVRPIIRLEFGARGVQLPAEDRTIAPYVSEAIPSLMQHPATQTRVLGIERTFWEKATILHMLFHQPEGKPVADRMSRHYYDMAMLIAHPSKETAMANLQLLEDVAHHKSVFFKAAWANYEKAKPGSLRLLPSADIENHLRQDYRGMREMIIGDVPDWDAIITTIGAVEAEINV
ncbi:nucleotidyl transferase AbiEii/AbiGii toxin family protein [Octadecabacter sp.]|nr:nucleotidyl transferase AbiEii/AbiGii toxin family protein [Octadecabacter sp.]